MFTAALNAATALMWERQARNAICIALAGFPLADAGPEGRAIIRPHSTPGFTGETHIVCMDRAKQDRRRRMSAASALTRPKLRRLFSCRTIWSRGA